MKEKKGVALLWAIVTGTVILLIGSVVANVVIKESKMTVDVENSSKAYAAAHTGIDWGKWCIDNLAAPTNCNISQYSSSPLIIGDSETTIAIAGGPVDYQIESIGKNYPDRTVTRKLLYNYKSSPFNTFSTANVLSGTIPGSASDSFSFMFDYWRSVSSSGTYDIGFRNASGTDYITIRINHSGADTIISAYYKATGAAVAVDTAPAKSITITGADIPNWNVPYVARLRLDYVKESSLQITFMKLDPATRVLASCTKRFSVDMSNLKFGTLTNFRTTTAVSAVTGVGDDDVIGLAAASPYFGYLDNFSLKD